MEGIIINISCFDLIWFHSVGVKRERREKGGRTIRRWYMGALTALIFIICCCSSCAQDTATKQMVSYLG
jgi:hypothetical protein